MLTSLLAVLGALGLLAVGYGLACLRLDWEYAQLQTLRRLVHGELVALQQLARLTERFEAARDAMGRAPR